MSNRLYNEVKTTPNKRKLLMIGLDCAAPELIFDQFKEDLPNIQKLIRGGISGKLRTIIPPITIPAWLTMMTGKSPGTLGLYGFRHRKGNSYTDIWIASSRLINEPAIWNILAKSNRKTCLVGFPPSYPPFPINGNLVSGFLTPSAQSDYTYPPELKDELEQIAGPYIPDINFRTENRDEVRDQLFEMLENHMKIIKHLIKTKEWDFFAFVEIGVDRAHHAFWKYYDETHHLYEPNSKYKNVIRDFYKVIDHHIGEILNLIDSDTIVLVTSDHGVKHMRGAFCINEWLIKEGLLCLKKYPNKPVPLEKAEIDWEKTKTWAWGGYYSRVFLNLKNREPLGNIETKNFKKELKHLQEKLTAIKDDTGRIMDNIIIQPTKYYNSPKGDYPDLMVIFDNLYWRAAGTIGHNKLYLSENDIGPDDAMHDWDGIFILYDRKHDYNGKKMNARIEDIAPTILNLLNEEIPSDIEGRVITNAQKK